MNPLQYAQKAILINEFSGGNGLSFGHNSSLLVIRCHSSAFGVSAFIVEFLIVPLLSLM